MVRLNNFEQSHIIWIQHLIKMKNKRNIITLLLCLVFGTISLAHNEPILVTKVIGEEKEMVFMNKVVDESISLYYETTPITEYSWTKKDGFIASTIKEIEVFYIGIGTKVEHINTGNFKRLLEKYLPNAQGLHKRIRKKGFKFENLPSIILFYNKQKNGESSPLTKKEKASALVL